MKLEQSFEVAAPLERVWIALIDVERVAPCLPGASVTGRNEDGTYNGNFKVKIGPTSAAYSGKLMMENVDESTHTATMQAQGTDKRGQGGAKATIVSSVREGSDGPQSARVEVVTDYHITGRLARFGRGGMIEDISNRLLGEFAKCLQTSLAGGVGGAADGEAAGGPAAGAPTTETATAPAAETAAAAPAETAAASGATNGPAGNAGSEAAAAAAAAGATPAGAETIAAEAPAATDGGVGAANAPSGAPGAPGAPGAAEGPGAPGVAAGTPGGAAPPQPPMAGSEPVEGVSLMASVLWNQAKRNPAPVFAMVLGFLLALRVFRHRN
jgi:carbon monoxide dehydrogenase subunit G